MNPVYETIALEASSQPSVSLENLAGDAYLKVDFTEFGYVEYKRDDPIEPRALEHRSAGFTAQ